jgi:3-oxoacyl-[acyl-carrier protein] reductase
VRLQTLAVLPAKVATADQGACQLLVSAGVTSSGKAFADLTGKTALITGAGSPHGIGYACARLLGRLGAEIVVAATTDRIHQRVADLGATGISAIGLIADLTDQGQTNRLVQTALGWHGRIDVLVNNAGMTSVSDPAESATLLDTTDAGWWDVLNRNLSSAFLVTRAVLPAMLAHGHGRIVNVASVSGPLVAYPGDAAYHAAKAGMTGLTRALAVEVGRRGITVNAVAPGWIATASSPEHEIKMGRATPVGRPGTADEVAAAVAFLAAPEASYISGRVLVVDGANSVQEEKGA